MKINNIHSIYKLDEPINADLYKNWRHHSSLDTNTHMILFVWAFIREYYHINDCGLIRSTKFIKLDIDCN